MVEKEYNPHVVVVWMSSLRGSGSFAAPFTTVAVKEYPFKEDAEEKYNELIHADKVVLAKVVKSHGEG
jgi:hypothetical protein